MSCSVFSFSLWLLLVVFCWLVSHFCWWLSVGELYGVFVRSYFLYSRSILDRHVYYRHGSQCRFYVLSIRETSRLYYFVSVRSERRGVRGGGVGFSESIFSRCIGDLLSVPYFYRRDTFVLGRGFYGLRVRLVVLYRGGVRPLSEGFYFFFHFDPILPVYIGPR